MSELTVPGLLEKKRAQEPICMLTAYDATQAQLVEAGGVDAVLVGDSLGMVVQGHASTLPVTLADMVYHTRCVAAGLQQPLLITDLPMLSEATPDRAAESARQVMAACAQRRLFPHAPEGHGRRAHLAFGRIEAGTGDSQLRVSTADVLRDLVDDLVQLPA